MPEGSQEAGFTQPRDHSFAQPCIFLHVDKEGKGAVMANHVTTQMSDQKDRICAICKVSSSLSLRPHISCFADKGKDSTDMSKKLKDRLRDPAL